MKCNNKSSLGTKGRYIILWVLFFGYFIFNGILLWGHELWRDEANVWLLARNYCLIALFLILLAYLYPKRNENSVVYGLMLGLLVQTDTIALIAAGLISVMWMWEGVSLGLRNHNWELCKKTAKGLWIPLVSLFLLLLQFVGVSESPEYDPQLLPVKEMVRAIFNNYYIIFARLTGQGGKFILLLTLLFLVTGALLSQKLRNLLPMIVAAGVFMYQAAFSVIIYPLHIWHNIVICFALIWFLWLGCADGNRDEENPKQWVNLSGRIWAEVLLIFGKRLHLLLCSNRKPRNLCALQ